MLIDDLQRESRRYLASYVMFNQAVADHLKLHTTGRIAELTGLTSGSATRLVDRLEKAGCVVRRRDKTDRRRVLVEPVPEAMRDLMKLWAELGEGWRAMFADYTEDELALLYRHMRRAVELSRQQIARLRGKD